MIPAELPVIFYSVGDRTISHAVVNRMKVSTAATADLFDDPLTVCRTAVPAVMCECGRYFLARKARRRVNSKS